MKNVTYLFNNCRGNDFRKDYGKLGVLCAMFPDIPVMAMTATASSTDMKLIQNSLGLKKCKVVVGNPDRRNIYYEKVVRHGKDYDAVQAILMPIAKGLLEAKIKYPLTIIYISLKLCGFAYKLFEHVLGNEQYFPVGSSQVPSNRLFAQFHAPQTKQMKDEILVQLCSQESIIRVVFATVAMGMGVDISGIRKVIHFGPPCTVKAYFQETGHAGRDGKPASAVLYYNNRDINKKRVGMLDDMRDFCSNKQNKCLRSMLLKALDFELEKPMEPQHLCCSECKPKCECSECLYVLFEKM